MEFNIALNTIVYLMVFIFPGMIFRKFYYIREYSKEFDKGNLFERFIFTLFTSVIMLVLSYLIYTVLVDFLGQDHVPYISYETIRGIHEQISTNQLPNEISPDTYQNFSYLMLSIYIMSGVFGIIWYFITKSSLFKKSGCFKKINYWEDLFKGFNYKNIDDSLTHVYTFVDVLIDTGEGNKLYSGKLENYYLNHDNNQLQTIVLSSVNKYKKNEKNVERIQIPGHNFLVERDKILNVNFTYIFEKKSKFIVYIYWAINILSVVTFIFSILSLFYSINEVYTSTFLRKGIFILCAGILILLIQKLFKFLISRQWSKFELVHLYMIILFTVPFLWIYNFFSWYIVLFILFGFLIIVSIIVSIIVYVFSKEKNKEEDKKDS